VERARSLARTPVGRLALVEILRTQAATSSAAVSELQLLASGVTKSVANAAASAIADFVVNNNAADPTLVLRLSQSRFANVRALAVSALTRRITSGRPVNALTLVALYRQLAGERHEIVMRVLCELCGEWARAVGESLHEALDMMAAVADLMTRDGK